MLPYTAKSLRQFGYGEPVTRFLKPAVTKPHQRDRLHSVARVCHDCTTSRRDMPHGSRYIYVHNWPNGLQPLVGFASRTETYGCKVEKIVRPILVSESSCTNAGEYLTHLLLAKDAAHHPRPWQGGFTRNLRAARRSRRKHFTARRENTAKRLVKTQEVKGSEPPSAPCKPRLLARAYCATECGFAHVHAL